MRYVCSFRLLLSALLLISATACDGVVEVEGNAVSASGESLDDCKVVLFRASDDYELAVRPVDPHFSAIFTVMPWRREYYAEVTCAEHSTYRSAPFTSEAKLGDPPVELGTFQLQPTAPE